MHSLFTIYSLSVDKSTTLQIHVHTAPCDTSFKARCIEIPLLTYLQYPIHALCILNAHGIVKKIDLHSDLVNDADDNLFNCILDNNEHV